MPSKPKKPCAYPGCPNLTHDTYCEEHEALRHKQYDKYNRAPNHDKKYGNNWRRIISKKQVESGVKPLFSFVIMLMSACFGMNCFL